MTTTVRHSDRSPPHPIGAERAHLQPTLAGPAPERWRPVAPCASTVREVAADHDAYDRRAAACRSDRPTREPVAAPATDRVMTITGRTVGSTTYA